MPRPGTAALPRVIKMSGTSCFRWDLRPSRILSDAFLKCTPRLIRMVTMIIKRVETRRLTKVTRRVT